MTNKKDKATLITNKAKDLVVPAMLLNRNPGVQPVVPATLLSRNRVVGFLWC